MFLVEADGPDLDLLCTALANSMRGAYDFLLVFCAYVAGRTFSRKVP